MDDLGQRVENRRFGMLAIAVGAFADEIVALRRRSGIVVKGPVVATDVAGEEDPQRVGAVANLGLDHVRTEQMPRVVEPHRNRRRRREPLAAGDRLKELHRPLDVAAFVERQRGLVLRVAFAVGVLGVLLLNLRRVEQNNLGQVARGVGARRCGGCSLA